MKNSILGKARWLRDVALATSKNNGARVAREWLKYAAMFVMLFTIGSGNAWGADVLSYTITYAKGNDDSGTAAAVISTGSDYASLGSLTNAYKRTNGMHLSSGKKSGSATLTMTTDGQVVATKIVTNALAKSGKSFTITVNYVGGGSENKTFTPGTTTTDCEFSLTNASNKKIASIVYTANSGTGTGIASTSVYVAGSTPKTFTLAVPKGDGTYDQTQTGQEKTALTETNAISAVSCGNGLNGTYANMWTSTAIGTPTYTYPSNVVTSSTADGDLPASGTTLYAVFTTNDEGKYTTNPVCNPACTNGTVSYATGSTTYTGGNAITGSHVNDTKTCGTNMTLPGVVFTTTGYTQDGWATSDGGSKIYDLSATNYATEGDATLYPHWTANKYTVTWSVNGSTYTTTENVAYNTTTSTPKNPSVPGECTGSTFMGWTENSSWASDSAPGDLFNGTTPTITGNKTFYAVFADEN